MTFRQPIRTGAIAATFMAFTALSGCVMDAPAPGGRFARSGAAEGNWADTGGVATSSFNGGVNRARLSRVSLLARPSATNAERRWGISE